MKLTLVATCMFGLEKQLGEEIDALGLKRIETIDGRVYFEGEEKDVARCNLNFRVAEHVFILLGRYRAETYADLFDGCFDIAWADWIGIKDAFPIKGHSIKSKLYSVPDCQSIINKAIAKKLTERYHISWFEQTGTKYQIEFFLFKDMCDLMIDTSGIPLHKRGYRPDSGPAPIRETLAASILLTSRPKTDLLYWDPMCGSGTLAIECALIQANIAPGINRNFAGESFPQIPKKIWNEARGNAIAMERRDIPFEIYASDIDAGVLKTAFENAKRADVSDYIRFFRADARKIQKPDGRKGTIVCNPPYGDRMMDLKEAELLYKKMGETFRSFAPWAVYVITSHPSFDRLYGQKADRIQKRYNGMIECFLYQFFKNNRGKQ